jgi:pyruvate formate lyase activating enzyme
MPTHKNSHDAKALILEIQRMSTEDGPGIRTTVFFKGCGLRCDWCHNPESISSKMQIQWIGSRCIGCGTCVDSCQNGALAITDKGMQRKTDRCEMCARCTDVCPSTAMERIGKEWRLPDLVHEVLKDKAYYDTSEGGVTVSGGDPLLQYLFVKDFLKRLLSKGIHTAIDTCGLCNREVLAAVLPYTDMVLYDLKLADLENHRRYTGVSNERILANLAYVREYMQSHIRPSRIWVRTPIIPGATATAENIDGIGRLIHRILGSRVNRWELCAFNNLCRDKYLRLDMDWKFRDCQPMTKEAMEEFADIARNSGVDPEVVHWSGATKTTDDADKGEKDSAPEPVARG